MTNPADAGSALTHFDTKGDAHMVNIAGKALTHRKAVAGGRIQMQQHTLDLIQNAQAAKGDVLGVARVAGIMAAKKTSDLIPLCHPIMLTRVAIEFEVIHATATTLPAVQCVAIAETTGGTGVEMEALTAVQITLLTIYDMCKAVDKGMVMTDVRLLENTAASRAPTSHHRALDYAANRLIAGLRTLVALDQNQIDHRHVFAQGDGSLVFGRVPARHGRLIAGEFNHHVTAAAFALGRLKAPGAYQKAGAILLERRSVCGLVGLVSLRVEHFYAADPVAFGHVCLLRWAKHQCRRWPHLHR